MYERTQRRVRPYRRATTAPVTPPDDGPGLPSFASWHVSGGLVKIGPVSSAADRRTATFTHVNSLTDARCRSFTTADGGSLRHRDFPLRAEPADGSPLFRQDAAFCPRSAWRTGSPEHVTGAVAHGHGPCHRRCVRR
ncbi:AbfB domain-containing protein [Streptomyces olivaceoviridis]